MKKQIEVFSHEVFGQIRTMTMPDGQIGFVGKDVATSLGYKDASNAVYSHVDDEDKTTLVICQSGTQMKTKTTFINESGLYSLILSSKLPQAKQFKHWVTSEVLPQIRQTGGYIPVKEEDNEAIIMARALEIMQRTLAKKDELVEEMKPKALFADAVSASSDCILVRDLAKLLCQNGIKVGQNRLFDWLRENGYFHKKELRPTQRYVEKGLFKTNVTLVETNHGTRERLTTKVTGKGQRYFIEGFLNHKFVI